MLFRPSWIAAFLVLAASAALIVFGGVNNASEQSPVSVPANAESARADTTRADFPGGDSVPAILVVTRTDGSPLTPADVAATESARTRILDAATAGTAAPPTVVSEDGRAAVATVPLDGELSGFALSDAVQDLRAAATADLPADLTAEVTGGPAFGADIANSFAGANFTLLAVTAIVVAVLLIVTYRSPVLWLVPLLVIALADRVGSVAGTTIATAAGTTPDGSTTGITSVLVFGAGTNYALLLISRYREELSVGDDHRAAVRRALRHAGPAVIASNATVVLALLTLLLASSPSTRSLGVQAAAGLVVAAVYVLVVLPPVLSLFGRRLFWPFIPKVGALPLTTTGVWHRIAAAVAARPVPIASAAVVVLALLCAGIAGTPVGLSQTEQFRVQAESVTGYTTLAEHFPSGVTSPTRVVGPADRADVIGPALASTPGVVSAVESGRSSTGLAQWSVVLDAEPGSPAAFDTITALRDNGRAADPGVLVGGTDATALDARTAAERDQLVVIPAILVVVLLVLYVLLRAVLAPLVLIAATMLSALAALGLGGWISVHAFGFPALDNTTPLFAILFLVALGVDYTIFLVTRAREETPEHGNREGIVRAVSATGAVITSAGIVLAAVFCVLGVLPLIVLTQIGIIVGLGILLDTFVVRTVIIPAVFAAVGPVIWWPALRPKP